jgi:hypothetical protein
MTFGTDKVAVHHNSLVLQAKNNYSPGFNSWGRAVWVGLPNPDAQVEFYENSITALNSDGLAKAAAVAVVCANESPRLVFRDNTITSNWCNLLLADNYGAAGGYARFSRNRFVRKDTYDTYLTIRSQYRGMPSTAVLVDNTFVNGASPDLIDLEFGSASLKELKFGWRLSLTVLRDGKPATGARIEVRDNAGATVFSGTTDTAGSASADVVTYLLTNQGKKNITSKVADKLFGARGTRIDCTPHTVVVTYGGHTSERTVTLNGNSSLDFSL